MEQQKASNSLQLELLSLLVFYEAEGKQVRSSVELELFDSPPIRFLAKDIYEFIDTYKSVPKEHFNEIIQPYLNGKDAELYQQVYSKLGKLKDGINTTYILSKLDEFISTQNLYRGILNALKALEQGNVEKAKGEVLDAAKKSTTLNDPGVFLSASAPLLYQPSPRMEFTSGIPELDQSRICPGRGELMMILGLSGKRKSWAVIHMGLHNALQGKKVCHISLEMPTRQVCVRYIQGATRITSDMGMDLSFMRLTPGPARDYLHDIEHKRFPGLLDSEIKDKLPEKLKAEVFNRIVVKHWPSRTLTIPKVETYLDMLQAIHGYMPDILIVDYPEEFYIPKTGRDRRDVVIADITRDLRRIAEERNLGVIAPSQSNRGGKNKASLTEEDLAEAYGKFPVVDVGFSLNASNEELKMGIMRIKILKNREGRDFNDVIITSLIDAGQFVTSSAFLHELEYEDWIKNNVSGVLSTLGV